MVPAEDVVPLVVAVAVFAENIAVNPLVLLNLLGGEFPVELVNHPGNGAFGDKPSGEYAITHLGVNEPKFGIGVNHTVKLRFGSTEINGIPPWPTD
jgi:hypothetical protein